MVALKVVGVANNGLEVRRCNQLTVVLQEVMCEEALHELIKRILVSVIVAELSWDDLVNFDNCQETNLSPTHWRSVDLNRVDQIGEFLQELWPNGFNQADILQHDLVQLTVLFII